VIDLHNHVLPGVDDGAHDLKMSLRMLRIAADQGITRVACTPHANDRANPQTDRLFQSVFQKLREAVAGHGLSVELCLASELMLGADLLRVLSLPFASYNAEKKYCLIEFPVETPFEIILNVVKTIRRSGPRSVLAHFERFSRAQRTADQVKALRREGAIISLDAGSLKGQFGSVIEKRSRQLLEWKVVDLLASDAHDDGDHGFRLKAGCEAAAAIIGAEAAERLVLENPQRIWEGAPWTQQDEDKQSPPRPLASTGESESPPVRGVTKRGSR
jgi:protein-tyrosine phosphatase